MNYLTNSCISCFRTCPKMYYYNYVLRYEQDREAQPLRMGSAVHLGLETFSVIKATEGYTEIPPWCQDDEGMAAWLVEREVVMRLLEGYWNHYGGNPGQGIDVVHTEQEFDLKLSNPKTGRTSRKFRRAGKIDKIVKLPDGRLALMEHKTTGQLDDGYWSKLNVDSQVSMYQIAALDMGYDVQTTCYDVLRKPSIRPKLTDRKAKIKETPYEYSERLAADIAERPEWYYHRREIPRLRADLLMFRQELWAQASIMNYHRVNDVYPRNTGACRNPYPCQYREFCHLGLDVSEIVPDGFRKKARAHVELNVENV